MKSQLGFVGRSRAAKERAEAKRAKWVEDAPIRDQLNSLRIMDRAKMAVATAETLVAEAEAAAAKWENAAANLRKVMGLDANPRELRALTDRTEIARQVAADRRQELEVARATLASLVPAEARKKGAA